MKRICVFSDSHGYGEHMARVIRAERPDLVIHLGDGESDLRRLEREVPDLPVENVRGNCDVHSDALPVLRTTVGGKRIFATHGHKYNVKLDPQYQRLLYAALEDEADIVLFGHTHVPYRDRVLSMDILNPGAVGDVACPTYGLVTIDGDRVTTEIRRAL